MLFYDSDLKEKIEKSMELQSIVEKTLEREKNPDDRLKYYHRLDWNLVRLADWVRSEGGSHCMLYNDFAPYSFYFELYVPSETPSENTIDEWSYLGMRHPQLVGYHRLFVGGLIYSGPGYPDDGSGPSFSVNVTPTTGWSIHT